GSRAHPDLQARLRPHNTGETPRTGTSRYPDPCGIELLIEAGRLAEATSLAYETLVTGDRPPEAMARLRLTLSSLLFMSGRIDESMDQASAVLTEPGLSGSLYAGAELIRLRWLVT